MFWFFFSRVAGSSQERCGCSRGEHNSCKVISTRKAWPASPPRPGTAAPATPPLFSSPTPAPCSLGPELGCGEDYV